MEKRTSAPARIVAAIALAAAAIVIAVAIAGSLGGGSSEHHHSSARAAKHHHRASTKPTPATYTVQSGDTLTSIAHENGVSVARIRALNPEVDPQILVAGETLKLR
jgi:LysM repeat protein